MNLRFLSAGKICIQGHIFRFVDERIDEGIGKLPPPPCPGVDPAFPYFSQVLTLRRISSPFVSRSCLTVRLAIFSGSSLARLPSQHQAGAKTVYRCVTRLFFMTCFFIAPASKDGQTYFVFFFAHPNYFRSLAFFLQLSSFSPHSRSISE